ncbi:MAG: methyltransferase domain-containing protein [Planctomycetes bacterium]|nr:methyltransferase domain-containing protein [Planctomycetota bacterium]MCC7170489.1 methyltransferase domain-containing protein [Planctomycetota bacterium]
MSLAERVVVPERMDAPDLDPGAHADALRGLRRLNLLAASPRLLWPVLEAFAARTTSPLRVVDVACGGGDGAIAIARKARARGLAFQVTGLDLSATALEHAREAASRAGALVTFDRADVVNEPALPCVADVFTCSLFLHHTSRAQAIALLERLAGAARLGIVVVDLLRTRLGYALATAAARLVTRSPIVHFDAAASVRAAFTRAEIETIARAANLRDSRIDRVWPERFRLVWSRT